MFFFFFFQAEDGIRDATVTGVQTCALPILRLLSLSPPRRRGRGLRRTGRRGHRVLRSEERRVGKEGRSRWAPYHSKKKKEKTTGEHTGREVAPSREDTAHRHDVDVFFCCQAEDGIRYATVTGVQTCAFFFQAEDGIRDATVTGVQTCALPIFEQARARSLELEMAFEIEWYAES